jgi:hypothetical protein
MNRPRIPAHRRPRLFVALRAVRCRLVGWRAATRGRLSRLRPAGLGAGAAGIGAVGGLIAAVWLATGPDRLGDPPAAGPGLPPGPAPLIPPGWGGFAVPLSVLQAGIVASLAITVLVLAADVLHPTAPPPRADRRTVLRRRRRAAMAAIAVVVVLAVVVVVAVTASAAGGPVLAQVPPPPPAPPPTSPDLNAVLNNLRNWLIGILAAIATLFFTLGGLRYAGADGDPSEVERAKQAFKNAAVGYGLAILAPIFLTALKSVVGA